MRICQVARKRKRLDFSYKFLESTINLVYSFLWKWSFVRGGSTIYYHKAIYLGCCSSPRFAYVYNLTWKISNSNMKNYLLICCLYLNMQSNMMCHSVWKWMGVEINNKSIKVTRCSVTSQSNAKNEHHKHQVKIYTAITLSLHLIPFLVL